MIVGEILDTVSDAMLDLKRRRYGERFRPLDIVLLNDRTGICVEKYGLKCTHEGIIVSSHVLESKKLRGDGLHILVVDKQYKKPVRIIKLDQWDIVGIVRPRLHPIDRFLLSEIKQLTTGMYKKAKMQLVFGSDTNIVPMYLSLFKLITDGKLGTFIYDLAQN